MEKLSHLEGKIVSLGHKAHWLQEAGMSLLRVAFYRICAYMGC